MANPWRRAVVLCLLMACGFIAGKKLRVQSTAPEPAAVAKAPATPPRTAPAATPGAAVPAVPLDLRSTDTLADLLAVPSEDLYERLALWLVDATADDMAAYWTATKTREHPDNKLNDLLFVQWTVLDPLGAIAAAVGTPYAHIPWWAWAKNEPTTAFEHAMAHDRSRIEIVLRAIGQSNPKLALKLLNDHPELPPNTGRDGILFGLRRDDPEAAVKLANESGSYYDSRPMQAWIREDPHSAAEWYFANRSPGPYFSFSRDLEFIKSLSAENPALLGEFASKLPDGDFRRKMESAAFDHLVRNDPTKALEQARKTSSPIIATEQKAKVALRLLDEAPQLAKSLFAEMLEQRPDFLIYENKTRYPNGSSGSQELLEGAKPLLNRLIATNPQGTLQQLIDANPVGSMNSTTRQAASQWVAKDPETFAAWAATQASPSIRDESYQLLIHGLTESREFESAMRHAAGLDDSTRAFQTQQVLRQWQQTNPAAAGVWAEANGINLENP